MNWYKTADSNFNYLCISNAVGYKLNISKTKNNNINSRDKKTLSIEKTASTGDYEIMHYIMDSIREARAKHGNLEDLSSFLIRIGDHQVPVVNSSRFPSPALFSRSIVEGFLAPAERPKELESVAPADPVVTMVPHYRGFGYDTVLFHELVHSQQILRMWKRKKINNSGMSHKDVVEGWRDRSIRIPMSPYVDEEYGSVHGEIHAYLMHSAYAAIMNAAKKIASGINERSIEDSAVIEAIDTGRMHLSHLRSATMAGPEDKRFRAFMMHPAREYGVDMNNVAVKPRWRMKQSKWDSLIKRMELRMEFLIRKIVREMVEKNKRKGLSETSNISLVDKNDIFKSSQNKKGYKIAEGYSEYGDFREELQWWLDRGVGSSMSEGQIREAWDKAPIKTISSRDLDRIGNTYTPEVRGRGVESRMRKFLEYAATEYREDTPKGQWQDLRQIDPNGYLKKLLDVVSSGNYPPANIINVKGIGKAIVGGRTRAAAARVLGVPLKAREIAIWFNGGEVSDDIKGLFYNYMGRQ